MTVGLGHYLSVAAILFTLGIFGIFINRKNVIVILMSIELILLAVNINLVSFSSFLGDLVGQVFALLVLFLFVVMMLDVDFAELRQGFLSYLPVGALVGLVVLVELLLVVGGWVIGPGVPKAIKQPIPPLETMTNTEALGRVLYTDYVYFFQAAGLVLLVAMVGAIVLTLRHRVPVKRQDMAAQVRRTKAEAMEVVKVRPGQGLT